ncbi:MAG: DUF3181 family protein [Spirulinaceae cyanobacterium RM2_2_10]|nr:DUF3181 family protein [Spirulinaceae cyanobacterium SM2_1_0]NJO20204.1 DUF3181 family protein [Spirulinaceae cyanobacterium RM2_2_10]
MSNPSNTEAIERLAAQIGEVVYIDIAKWHLYLNDAQLHTSVAEQLFPLLVDSQLDEDRVLTILRSIPVKIGGGQRELPLADLLPMQCQVDLMDLLEAYQREL